jgi:hypothetical protein
VFLVLTVLFFGSGATLLLASAALPVASGVAVILAAMALQAYMWLRFAGKLYCLGKGCLTVDAYCWRFVPIRYNFLLTYDPKLTYSVIT